MARANGRPNQSAIRVTAAIPGAIIVRHELGTSQVHGQPERTMDMGWSVRVEFTSIQDYIRVDERFTTKGDAVKAGKEALRCYVARLSSRFSLSDY